MKDKNNKTILEIVLNTISEILALPKVKDALDSFLSKNIKAVIISSLTLITMASMFFPLDLTTRIIICTVYMYQMYTIFSLIVTDTLDAETNRIKTLSKEKAFKSIKKNENIKTMFTVVKRISIDNSIKIEVSARFGLITIPLKDSNIINF